jgi:glycosyltransferase involved in cell wall biosynthesis
MTGISVVVPAFNSSRTLPILTRRIFAIINDMGGEFELILVNDGSSDSTWEVIVNLASKYYQITGFNLSRNFGQHNALLCGVRSARFDTCVTLDDDLQHPPEEIPKLVEKLDQGLDIIYGVPRTLNHGSIRNFVSTMIRWLGQTLFGIRRGKILSAFRAFRTSLRYSFQDFNGPYVSIDPMLASSTDRIGYVEIRHDVRHSEKSNYTLRKLFKLSLVTFVGFNGRFLLAFQSPGGKPSYIVSDITSGLK